LLHRSWHLAPHSLNNEKGPLIPSGPGFLLGLVLR
jgi:hypothetical protein